MLKLKNKKVLSNLDIIVLGSYDRRNTQLVLVLFLKSKSLLKVLKVFKLLSGKFLTCVFNLLHFRYHFSSELRGSLPFEEFFKSFVVSH